MMQSALLSVSEACDYLSLSRRALSRLQGSGSIKFVRIGRAVRFRRSDLDEFIASCVVNSRA